MYLVVEQSVRLISGQGFITNKKVLSKLPLVCEDERDMEGWCEYIQSQGLSGKFYVFRTTSCGSVNLFGPKNFIEV